MRIGIVGSNDRAQAIGALLKRGGHELTFGDPLSPQRAEIAARRVGTHAELPYRQAIHCELVVFAVPYEQVDRAVTALGSPDDAIIVDAVERPRAGKRSDDAMLARKLDSHRVVRAFITAPAPGADVSIWSDDATSKFLVERALQSAGCLVTDRGPLSAARELTPAA